MADARVVAVVGAVLSALVLGAALVVVRPFGRGEAARIATRHGHRIVHVGATSDEDRSTVVEITTMADLVRLAEQYGCLILHQEADGAHTYRSQIEQTHYCYVIDSDGV